MLKMYHTNSLKGGTPDHWEENWKNNDFERALLFCDADPLLPLFKRYARPSTKMLEGGCGHGHYVAYYAARDVKVVGLDFAQETLRRLHTRGPGLKLCAGDVGALPFRDGTFDLYYSGGVVEHFEGGPEGAIAEARRVLQSDGILLISVPYLSLLRRTLAPFRTKMWKQVAEAEVEEDISGSRFFQYVYTRKEFERILARAGLRVISTQGYGILWGLYDLTFMESFVQRFAGSNGGPGTTTNQIAGTNNTEPLPSNSSRVRRLVKRLVVNEDDSVPVAGLGIRLMRGFCANMMMYVCTRS